MTNRREVVQGLFTLLAAQGLSPGQDMKTAWPDAVFTVESATTTKSDFGETTVYFEGRTDQLKSMTGGTLLLKPGREPHPPHRHPEEEFVIIGEGNGEILVHDKVVKVRPGALMFCESNRLHGIKNTGSTPLRFYFLKWIA